MNHLLTVCFDFHLLFYLVMVSFILTSNQNRYLSSSELDAYSLVYFTGKSFNLNFDEKLEIDKKYKSAKYFAKICNVLRNMNL